MSTTPARWTGSRRRKRIGSHGEASSKSIEEHPLITEWLENIEAGVTHPQGFRAAAVRCGLKTEGLDLGLIVSETEAAAAGVFTTNVVHASCVTYSRSVANSGRARAVLCNAGNANACNGERGHADTVRSAEIVAAQLGLRADLVMIASTGIIGQPLP